MGNGVAVIDTDPLDLPGKVARGETCEIHFMGKTVTTVVNITVDEAQVLREQITRWLFKDGA
jgi:excinuclease UvrABC ATPase subunit